jgi:hypothetical protein
MVSEVGGEWEWEERAISSKDVHAAERAIFGSITVWHHVLKLFCSTYICIYNKSNLFLFNTLSTCKYFQVPVDPQVLENPWVFDPWLWVTRWLKPTRIQVWHFEFEIPVGTDPGHPRVHSCSALDTPQQISAKSNLPSTRTNGGPPFQQICVHQLSRKSNSA